MSRLRRWVVSDSWFFITGRVLPWRGILTAWEFACWGGVIRKRRKFVATVSAFLTVGSSQDICTKTRFEDMQSTDERVGDGQ